MEKKNLIRAILKKEPDKAVIEELAKVLTGYPGSKVPLKDLANATARLKVKLRRDFGKELERFYRRFLDNCLADRVLGPEDWAALQQLKTLFGFSNTFVEKIHNEMVMRHYSKTVEQVLSDKKINAKERSFLKTMQQGMRLMPEIAEKIYRDKASELVQRTLMTAISDERLSPDEEEELDSITSHLGVQVEYDEKTKNILDRYRLYWLIENGEIPAIDTAIKMSRNERCYFTADANWCELKTVTKSARYGTGPLKNDEGDHVQRQIFHELEQVDSGRIYLTNKRIYFLGSRREKEIPLTRVKDFEPMENGVQIHRKSGTHPFLQFGLGVDVFSMMLARALRDLYT